MLTLELRQSRTVLLVETHEVSLMRPQSPQSQDDFEVPESPNLASELARQRPEQYAEQVSKGDCQDTVVHQVQRRLPKVGTLEASDDSA